MAFMEKLGKVANKVGEVAGDTFDYGKAKGKILLEKGKVSDAKSAIGAYVYETRKNGGALDESRLAELCAEVDKHLQEIERLREDAKKSGEDISGAFDSMTDSAAPETAEAETEVKPETPAAESAFSSELPLCAGNIANNISGIKMRTPARSDLFDRSDAWAFSRFAHLLCNLGRVIASF